MKKSSSKDPFADREAKLYGNPIASREHIMQIVREYGKPCTLTKLTKLLKVKGRQADALERRLSAMVREGQLVVNRKGGFLPVNEDDLIRGRVIGHPDGFGFFQHEEGGRDYFIPPKQMRKLLHGDRVVMRKAGVNSRGRTEVSLVEVIERANKSVIGRLYIEDNLAYLVPENKHIHQDIMLQLQHLDGAKDGEIVVVDIVEQPNRHHPPVGKVSKIIGDKMAPGMEVHIAVHAHGVPHEWSDAVKGAIASIPDKVVEKDRDGRRDYTKLPLITIDGSDSKDFDDAVCCEAKEDGGWRLIVAIADVSHYVQPGSSFDVDAYDRGTSVYFANQVIPMLPEALSNGICSLNPKVDRLCMAVELHLDDSGVLTHYEFHRGVMHSHARLTYEKVAKILGMLGATDEELSALSVEFADVLPNIYNLNTVYDLRRKLRSERGAIDFETTETKILFDDKQCIEKIVPYERNEAHKIIEECMILANVAAAMYIDKHKVPALYRVHVDPPEDKLTDLRQFLNEISVPFPVAEPKPADYCKVLQSIQDREDRHLIQTILLRSMSQAVYEPSNNGHFGLSLDNYTHFTSPIRRYPDLVVHRAIGHIIDKGKPEKHLYQPDKVKEIGEYCSMAERRADDATRDAEDWLKCEYMRDKVGEKYEGIVSGVTSFGLFVELKDIFVEGLVHVTSLKKDYYKHDSVRHCLVGERSNLVYSLGDSIEIIVAAVNSDERKIDFAIEEVLKSENA